MIIDVESHIMGTETKKTHRSKCLHCGYEGVPGSTEWNRIDFPPLGRITQCPNCASTNILMR